MHESGVNCNNDETLEHLSQIRGAKSIVSSGDDETREGQGVAGDADDQGQKSVSKNEFTK